LVKEIANELIKSKIYPTDDELYEAAESYIIDKHAEFYESLSEKRWTLFYKNHIYSNVSLKIIFN